MSKKVVVIGAGIGGLGTAGLFAKKGYSVTVLEKNANLGGRANVFEAHGFRYDMGPSWYLAPDLFEHFFELMGEKVEDHLDLVRLSPSYRIFFHNDPKPLDIHSDIEVDSQTFESIEPGSAEKLKAYLKQSEYQYEVATQHFMYKNYDTIFDFFNKRVMTEGQKLSVFSKMHSFVSKFFKTKKLQQVMEYTMVFLGTSPYEAPALYNLMSHMDFNQGVFYPKGGFYELINALSRIAEKNGAELRTNAAVAEIVVENGVTKGVRLEGGEMVEADIVISNADIWFTETRLLSEKWQTHPQKYWNKRVMAPSAFIMYLGISEKLPNLIHHNLLFSEDWRKNFDDIYKDPQLPDAPSLYVCAPSVSDPGVAPEGKENLFVLVPIASDLKMTESEKESYSDKVIGLIEKEMGLNGLKDKIEYKRIYTVDDFGSDYNSFKGTALGLAHTIWQTAIFRPNNRSKKVSNLYYVGAGVNPGIGTQICLISAELVYKRVHGIKSAAPLKTL
ncbi:MAG TPA: phytoene desaturase family protein [Pyrinomonadaceae bacterium]|nr:phytoene desaturase [Chloracidobacterium sp.]HBE82192.1 phytoene desaturase [Blastocatellia bacterium]HRJ87101.1 phytoene desaturase family protein [Pyrinomonadaceae bacterium]HRK52036.1 phytoene desaturase family protein [Pyrinomonadaceae bacterium]